MKKETKKNFPVYFFLGFRLLEATYKRTSDDVLSSFGIKILESTLEKQSNTHILTIQFSMVFKNNDESTFVFNGGYHINDMKWYNELKPTQIDALFFSVLFPFVREKIYSLSNDYRGSIDIPTIDLRNADLTEGVAFQKENEKQHK